MLCCWSYLNIYISLNAYFYNSRYLFLIPNQSAYTDKKYLLAQLETLLRVSKYNRRDSILMNQDRRPINYHLPNSTKF
jgi:hypothetical protein